MPYQFTLALVLSCFLLDGCGTKGPLKLPEKPAAAATALLTSCVPAAEACDLNMARSQS